MSASGQPGFGRNAYAQTIRETEDPRRIERRVFAQVTHALEAYADAARDAKPGLVATGSDALARNQTLWGRLLFDVADERNGLPDALKARIISLALFVDRHTADILGGRGSVETLIAINQAIMGGLEGRRPDEMATEAGHGA